MIDGDFIEKTQDHETLSAYERAAIEGIDPRCIPQHLDGDPPVGDAIDYPTYTLQEQYNWRFLFNRQMRLLPGRASEVFVRGVEVLGMNAHQIPALRDLSRNMEAATGWRIARIPGLLHEKDFFTLLANRLFPSTDYIRGIDELDYTPAPDCFHDMLGHMPMLTNPAFADFYQLFGQVALNAEGIDRKYLETLHWFTVEFGLIRQTEGTRIFGAGILSSKGEVLHALSDDVTVHPFTVDQIIHQEYDVWHLQPVLFALNSFEQLVGGFRDWTRQRGLLN